MSNTAVALKEPNYLIELKNTQQLCEMLMKTPHFAKMGREGIFAIATVATSLGINPIKALMGGLYFVKGRVEMTYVMMGALIRSRGHSLTTSKLDEKSCTVHGKRCDTNDTASFTFTIEDAKKAGIYRNAWVTYPKNMLYARALSSLARQLFPDVIGNCYVEDEIGGDDKIKEPTYQDDNQIEVQDDSKILPEKRTEEEVKVLIEVFNEVPEYRREIEKFMNKSHIETFEDLTKEMYDLILKRAFEKKAEFEESDLMEAVNEYN